MPRGCCRVNSSKLFARINIPAFARANMDATCRRMDFFLAQIGKFILPRRRGRPGEAHDCGFLRKNIARHGTLCLTSGVVQDWMAIQNINGGGEPT
jgi:hypothetical protein